MDSKRKLDTQLVGPVQFHPMVSIIIPVYNGANYLREAIDSALAQTYDNLEIIVVNDGSNDDGATEQIALSYGDKIRYFSKINGGTSTALNLGISKMRGEYFSWLSHDDMYYRDKISCQIRELAKLDNKATIMMSDLDGIDANYQKIYETNYSLHIKKYPPRETCRIHPIIYNQTHGCTLLIPKVCFDKVGLFDEKELVAQDFEFFYRAFLEFPHKLIPKVLVTARDSDNRQGRRSKAKGNEEYSRLFIKIIENLTEEDYCSLAPSRIEFFHDMREFFTDAGYTIALDYINSKMFSNLQISSYDLMGSRFNGHNLHLYLREYGIDSKQLVLYKQSNDGSTFLYDFDSPNSSKELLEQSIFLNADIVHLHLVHNLLDLNYLPIMSQLKPIIITLHDPFFLGGHCVHHFGCEKWKAHCYDCQYLEKDFKLFFDSSALNFALKKQAIQNSDISAIVASEWMKRKVACSPIWQGKPVYLLPFGIDQTVFKPATKEQIAEIRKGLNIAYDDIVIMFRSDTWEVKGLDIILKSLKNLKNKAKIALISVGTKGLLKELSSDFNILEFDWVNNDEQLANLYQASNIFLMPSRQETFGLMAVEAMSCGKLVLAIEGENTALPEIISSPNCGIAVPEEQYPAELERLIATPFETLNRGNKCADFAREKYSKERYITQLIRIYSEVIQGKTYDKDTLLLLEQLKKYSNDKFTISESKSALAPIKSIVKKNSWLKAAIRHVVNWSWNVAKSIGLENTIKTSKLYSRLKERGIVDKLKMR